MRLTETRTAWVVRIARVSRSDGGNGRGDDCASRERTDADKDAVVAGLSLRASPRCFAVFLLLCIATPLPVCEAGLAPSWCIVTVASVDAPFFDSGEARAIFHYGIASQAAYAARHMYGIHLVATGKSLLRRP